MLCELVKFIAMRSTEQTHVVSPKSTFLFTRLNSCAQSPCTSIMSRSKFEKSVLKLAALSMEILLVPLLVIWKLRAIALYCGKIEYDNAAETSE